MNMVQASLALAQRLALDMPVRDEYTPWFALGRVKGLGCVGFKKLAAHFDNPTEALFATRTELEQIDGLHRDVIDELVDFSSWSDAEEEARRVRAAGVNVIRYTDSSYPARMRAIADPPPYLYVKGSLIETDQQAVAIVGSRSASDYGCRLARDLARGLAELGFTVVSGMARGIDGAAHDSALRAGGRTIAVLGSGVERAYPPEHAELYGRITESGAVLSELALGTRPMAFNFPARNRLISGLSLGVVVVEATEKSGSLITAASALDQGREIFAVPGPAGASRSRGTHRLIRQGAKLVENVNDIIEEIAPQLARRGAAAEAAPRSLPPGSAESAHKVFALLQENSLHIDQVIEQSGLPPAEVLEILLDLELQGFLRQAPGKIFSTM